MRPPHAGVLPTLQTLVVAVVAVLGLGGATAVLVPDAAAAGTPARTARTATAVSGWSTTPVTIATGAVLRTRVRVTGGARSVHLERRVGGAWRAVDVARSTRSGAATLVWTTPTTPSDVTLRVRVPATATRRAATTAARQLLVRTPVTTTTTPDPDPGPDPEPVPEPPTSTLAAYQQEVLDLTNQARAAGATCGGVRYAPVGPVTAEPRLARAAVAHAVSMAGEDYFSHTGSDGSSAGDRISAQGYRWRTWGENIAAGYPTPSAVVRGWLASAGHCRNLMNGAFTQLGVGYGTDAGSTYGSYWVQVFASPA
jgi:uncharacterized protein YkwD